jgi:uncharacterized protein (UPF0303 family)
MAVNALVDSIAAQEEALIFDTWDEEMAWRIGSRIREWAVAGGWPIVIDIRLFHRPVFFAALPGATPDNVDWARRKANVVERFHKSTYRVGRELAAKQDTLANRYDLPLRDFADHGGGFPIRLRGAGVIGAVIVSGLPQREDHMLIVRALCEILGRDSTALPLADA